MPTEQFSYRSCSSRRSKVCLLCKSSQIVLENSGPSICNTVDVDMVLMDVKRLPARSRSRAGRLRSWRTVRPTSQRGAIRAFVTSHGINASTHSSFTGHQCRLRKTAAPSPCAVRVIVRERLEDYFLNTDTRVHRHVDGQIGTRHQNRLL